MIALAAETVLLHAYNYILFIFCIIIAALSILLLYPCIVFSMQLLRFLCMSLWTNHKEAYQLNPELTEKVDEQCHDTKKADWIDLVCQLETIPVSQIFFYYHGTGTR